jgi:hypothetical protein
VPNTGVRRLYRWLQDRESPDGLGGLYGRQWREFNRLFTARNQSLLGHGLTPMDQASWQSLQNRISNLLVQMLDELGISQGPEPCQLPAQQLLSLPALSSLLNTTDSTHNG